MSTRRVSLMSFACVRWSRRRQRSSRLATFRASARGDILDRGRRRARHDQTDAGPPRARDLERRHTFGRDDRGHRGQWVVRVHDAAGRTLHGRNLEGCLRHDELRCKPAGASRHTHCASPRERRGASRSVCLVARSSPAASRTSTARRRKACRCAPCATDSSTARGSSCRRARPRPPTIGASIASTACPRGTTACRRRRAAASTAGRGSAHDTGARARRPRRSAAGDDQPARHGPASQSPRPSRVPRTRSEYTGMPPSTIPGPRAWPSPRRSPYDRERNARGST